nr:hypothetical protein BHI3_31650 [Bacteriovorax sp. HI3]
MNIFITMLTLLLSFSSLADVKIIKSKINGTAVISEENVINIMNPTIEIDGKNYSLFGSEYSHSTGIYACKKLKMEFVGLTARRIQSVYVELVQVKQNGEMVFNDGLWSEITTLACKR